MWQAKTIQISNKTGRHDSVFFHDFGVFPWYLFCWPLQQWLLGLMTLFCQMLSGVQTFSHQTQREANNRRNNHFGLCTKPKHNVVMHEECEKITSKCVKIDKKMHAPRWQKNPLYFLFDFEMFCCWFNGFKSIDKSFSLPNNRLGPEIGFLKMGKFHKIIVKLISSKRLQYLSNFCTI